MTTVQKTQGQAAFERGILYSIEQTVPGSGAYFFDNTGCLCVPNTETVAREVFHALSDRFGLGRVQVNGPVQGEYLFDFV